MSVKPERKYELMEESCKRAADRHKRWEDRIWEEGLGVWRKAKPRDRFLHYHANTLPGDRWLVTDKDYMKLREEGLAPPLFAELQLQAYQAEQQALMAQQVEFDAQMQAAGDEDMITAPMPMQPTIQPPPMLWVLLLQVPRIFTRAGSDYRALLNEQLDKQVVA